MNNSKSKIYIAVLFAMFSTSALANDILDMDSAKRYGMKKYQHSDMIRTGEQQIQPWGDDVFGEAESTITLNCSGDFSGDKYKYTQDYGNTWTTVSTCKRNVPELRGRECPAPKIGSITENRMRTDYEDGSPSTYSNWLIYEENCAHGPVETITERSTSVMSCPAGMTPAENQARSVGAYSQWISGGSYKTVSYNYYDKVLALAEGPSEIVMARTGVRYSDGSIRDLGNWVVEQNNCYRAGLENENEDCHTGGPGMSETSPNVVNITIANLSKWTRTGLVGRTDMVWVKIPGSVSTQPGYMLGIWDLRGGNGKLNRFERATSEMSACSGA